MNVKDLKEKLKDIPDDVEVKILEEGGYLISVTDTWLDEDIDERIFVISH